MALYKNSLGEQLNISDTDLQKYYGGDASRAGLTAVGTAPAPIDNSIKNFSVQNGSFRGTQQEYNDYVNQIKNNPGTLYTAPPTFNAGQLGTSGTVKVAPEGNITDPSNFVATQQTFLDQYNASLAKAQEYENENSAIQSRLKNVLDSQKTSAQLYQEQEQNLGLASKRKQLEEMNLQIAQKTGEFDKAVQAIEGQGRGMTVGAVTGQQGAIRRQQAAEIGALASVQQALQGNYALAQQTADKAVELQFQDQQNEIKRLQLSLEMNYQNLSAAEKKKADSLSLVLQMRQEKLDQEKENRSQVLKLAGEAATAGADNATLSKITQAKTPEEALMIGANFFRPQAPVVSTGTGTGTGSGSTGTGDGTEEKPVDPTVQGWVDAINSGEATIANVPANLKNAVVVELNNPKNQVESPEESKAKEQIALIDELLTSKGMKGTVGPYAISRWTPFSVDASAKQSFIAGVQQLISQDTLKTLLDLKKGGGTLGALSDEERKMLQSAASKIASWAITDKNGKVTGYKVSEADFKKELNRLKSLAQKAIKNASDPLGITPKSDPLGIF